jgi:hypothetical protein
MLKSSPIHVPTVSLTTGTKSTKDTTKDPEYKSLGGPAETPAYGRRDRRGESQKTNSQ